MSVQACLHSCMQALVLVQDHGAPAPITAPDLQQQDTCMMTAHPPSTGAGTPCSRSAAWVMRTSPRTSWRRLCGERWQCVTVSSTYACSIQNVEGESGPVGVSKSFGHSCTCACSHTHTSLHTSLYRYKAKEIETMRSKLPLALRDHTHCACRHAHMHTHTCVHPLHVQVQGEGD